MSYFDPNLDHIEIGDHMDHRGVGDVLTLTSVIREVNQKYPDKKIIVKTTGDKSCFLNNPRIAEIRHELLDHSIDAPVTGHYIKKKCAWFGIDNPTYRNELFLTEMELWQASAVIKQLSNNKPVVLFSPNSSDRRRDWTPENWQTIVELVSSKYDVYQIDRPTHNYEDAKRGIFRDTQEPNRTIAGARQELRGIEWRKAMALMEVSGKYLGTNTGFLPMANAFGSNHFVYQDSRFVNPSEWEYPDNHNFYEFTDIDNVKFDIERYWLN